MKQGNLPDTGTFERPRLWRLAIQLEPELLRAVVWSTVQDSSLLQFSLPLDPTLGGHKALEEAIYAAPVLLSDFGRVDVIVRTDQYLTVPQHLSDDMPRRIADYACLSADPDTAAVRTDAVETLAADILWTIDEGTASFIARTFRNPALLSHMTPLLRYFGAKAAIGNHGKVYLHLHECGPRRRADIIVIDRQGNLALATTHAIAGEHDILYSVLAAMKQAGLDPHTDDVIICGNPAMRDQAKTALRRYVASVMPAIFPSAAFRAGHDALKAPFPLVILPLCE